MRNIILITGDFPPLISGVGDYVSWLAKSLARAGHEVSVLTTGQKNPADEILEGIRVARRIKRWDSSAWPVIRNFVRERRAGILHLQYHMHSFGNQPFAALLPFYLKSSFPDHGIVTTFHEFAAPWKRLALLPLLLGSDRSIVTNEHHWHCLGKIAPFLFMKDRMSLVPLAPNILPFEVMKEKRDFIRQQLGVKSGETLFVRFGILHDLAVPQLEMLLSALKILRLENPQVKLLQIGKQEPRAREAFLHSVKRNSMETSVLLKEELSPEEISAHLFASDIGLAPFSEGISEKRTAFLAMLAHGLPVIATRKGFFPSELKDGENMLGVSEDGEVPWSRVMGRLIADPGLCRKLSKGALSVARRHDWQAIAVQTAAVYEKCMRAVN